MLKEIFEVSNYPALSTHRPFKDKLLLLLKVYGIVFASMFLSAPLLVMADYLVTHVLHYKSVIADYEKTMQDVMHRLGRFKTIAYICVLGPLLEETVFRLSLTLKRQLIAITIAFALFFFMNMIPGFKGLNSYVNWSIRLAAVIAGYLLFIKILPQNITLQKRTHTRVIIASILVFGLMHISNFSPLHWQIIYLYPIFVIPQLLMGWALTYIRFKNGFFWGVALHVIINSVATGLHWFR
jgi:hypothetical protein